MAKLDEITKGRGLPGSILISFVNPSGVMSIPVEDGAITVRTYLTGCHINLNDPDDGLQTEMNGTSEPIPWRTEKQRSDALEYLAVRFDLEEDLRDRLIAHVKSTGWYG